MTGRRLICVNRFFHPDESATSQVLSDLAFHLAGGGWHVIVITSRSQGKGEGLGLLPRVEEIRGVRIYRVRTSRFAAGGLTGQAMDYVSFYIAVLFRMLRLVRANDIVIAKTDPPLVGVLAAMVVRVRGARLINWLQDLYPEVASALGIAGLNGRAGGLMAKVRDKALQASVCNVVIGRKMASRLEKRNIPVGKIRIIPNWTDQKAIRPMPPSQSVARAQWGILEDVCVIAYSGNLGRAHEAETLIEAARRLNDRKDILFLFIGSGRESNLLRLRAEREGIANFMFKPHQPRERLSDTLAVANVHWISLRPQLEGLIVPSKFYGIAAAGRPLIAVVDPNGEIGTLVNECRCGIVVTPGDGAGLAEAIKLLADNEELCREMGQAARAALDRNWSRDIAFSKWRELLESLDPPKRPEYASASLKSGN